MMRQAEAHFFAPGDNATLAASRHQVILDAAGEFVSTELKTIPRAKPTALLRRQMRLCLHDLTRQQEHVRPVAHE